MNTVQIHKTGTDYRSIVARVLAIVLAGMLLYTATKKVMDLKAFAAHIEVLPFIRTWMTYVLTAIVLIIEYGLAVVLLYYPIKRWVYLAVIALIIVYSAYIYAILHHALVLPCSCQGAFKSLSWEQHYLVNAAVAAVALTNFILVYRIHKYTNKQFKSLSV